MRMDIENYFYKKLNKIFISVFLLLTSCAPDSSNFANNFGFLPEDGGYKIARIFYIKGKIFTIKCDLSGNQLIMKFSKKEKKWKRSNYISKGCNFNFAELY